MELLQPLMLWGIGAVVIPVVIHFWHQKKVKTLDWAATRWLLEKDQQQQRGIKLDNLLLLLLRCLITALAAFLLSQPIINWLEKPVAIQKIHLVQPERILADNFRFELEEAIKKKEAVYWINTVPEPANDLSQLPDQPVVNGSILQSSINGLVNANTELHLYLINDQRLAAMPFVRVPGKYKTHLLTDSVSKPVRNYLAYPDNKKTFVNQFNTLTTGPVLDPVIRYSSAPIHAGPLAVLVNFRGQTEQRTVLAAVRALSDVYALAMQVDATQNPARKYDWILSDQDIGNPAPQTLYVVSGKLRLPGVPNVIYTEDMLQPQTAERVRTGQLPEWLGELLIRHFKLKQNGLSISPEELATFFVTTAKPDLKPSGTTHRWLLLAFVMLVGTERWIALKKNA